MSERIIAGVSHARVAEAIRELQEQGVDVFVTTGVNSNLAEQAPKIEDIEPRLVAPHSPRNRHERRVAAATR
jgi:hypothetical protein